MQKERVYDGHLNRQRGTGFISSSSWYASTRWTPENDEFEPWHGNCRVAKCQQLPGYLLVEEQETPSANKLGDQERQTGRTGELATEYNVS